MSITDKDDLAPHELVPEIRRTVQSKPPTEHVYVTFPHHFY